ncbi:acyl carrier protein [Micromonospora sp. NPDC047134]|uniref:acyl carrier protein n=1 Tax=Micromonospora sp. NPDC047134 TaxID=3154340 RepID=UPI0033DA7DC9
MTEVADAVRDAWVAAFDGMPGASADAAGPDPEADFFQAGGTSLLALMVTAELSDALGEEIPVRLLLQNPTLGGFTTALSAYLDEPAGDSVS